MGVCEISRILIYISLFCPPTTKINKLYVEKKFKNKVTICQVKINLRFWVDALKKV
jgi:hypothetical protein